MTASEIHELNDARKAAAFELVGTVAALLSTATRDERGNVVIRLGPYALVNVVDTFNRATHNDPITVGDVGR